MGEGRRIIKVSQCQDHGCGVHGDSTALCIAIDKIADQALDVPVEDQPDNLALAVNHRRTGVTTDNVAGAHKVESRGKIELVSARGIAFRQIEWRLATKTVGAVVESVTRGD